MSDSVNSLHNEVEDIITEGRRQTRWYESGETQATNHGTSHREVTLANVQVRVSWDTEGSANLSDVYTIIQKDGYKSLQQWLDQCSKNDKTTMFILTVVSLI